MYGDRVTEYGVRVQLKHAQLFHSIFFAVNFEHFFKITYRITSSAISGEKY